MTALSDTIQICLKYGFPGAMALFAALWICWRFSWAVLGWLWVALSAVLPPLHWLTPVILIGGAAVLSGYSEEIGEHLQYMEQRYWSPVTPGQYAYLGDAELIPIYEKEILRHVTPEQLDTIRRWTQYTADRIGSRPAAIYETAWLECGLNPFRVRDDRVAAGWIQFTRAGLSGLGVSLERVIQACDRRDVGFIMELTDRYLSRKADRLPEGATLVNTIDLYLAVFAPAHIGAPPGKVVYSGFANRAYTLNSGLDGWYLDGGKIMRSKGAIDGRITVQEIAFCLERKKANLLKN